jgi:hypothetical protein
METEFVPHVFLRETDFFVPHLLLSVLRDRKEREGEKGWKKEEEGKRKEIVGVRSRRGIGKGEGKRENGHRHTG